MIKSISTFSIIVHCSMVNLSKLSAVFVMLILSQKYIALSKRRWWPYGQTSVQSERVEKYNIKAACGLEVQFHGLNPPTFPQLYCIT